VTFGTQEGLYRCWPVPQRTENLAIAKVVLLSALLTIFALECSPHPNVSGVLLLGCTSLCGLLLVRHVSRAIRCRDGERSGAIVLGTGIAAKKVAEAISRNSDSGLSIKAFVSEIDCLDSSTVGRIAMREFADEIIIATEDRDAARTAIQHAQRNGLDVRVVPELFGVKHNELAVECISGMPLLKIHKERLPEWSLAVKRVADVALSMIGLLVISPLLAAVAGIIKLDSAGPILYRAVRVGRKRQQFICYKFRTMARDAEAFKNELRSRNERIGASFKMSNDPRITRVGHFLRRYSLDELPQLWNVLLGDMSLVGPRRILLMTWIGTACSICPGLTSLRG